MTVLELLIGTCVIMIIIALVGFQMRGLFQRAKVSAAKSTINAYALCLGMVRDDAFIYPAALSDVKEAAPPAGFSYRDWCGPYGQRLPVNDPWGNPYFYELTEGIVFGPDNCERTTGPPFDQTFAFSAPSGSGTLCIANFGVLHAGRVWINGEEIVHPNEFQNGIPEIVKAVTLSSGNSLRVRLMSNPNEYIVIRITSPRSRKSTFRLRSLGRNREDDDGTGDDIEYRKF